MRLSEAMRLGAMLKPQCFDDYKHYVYDGDKEGVIGTCALGAAIDAVGALDTFDEDTDIFPVIDMELVDRRCPECSDDRIRLGGMVSHLNDYHKWTRERIADWVATIEPPEDVLNDRTELPRTVDAVDPVGERVTG